MFIHNDYDDSYDVKQLQRLPMFHNMTEKEIRHLMTKIAVMENQQWEAEVKAMLLDQRKKTLEYLAKMEAGEGYKPLPMDPVIISRGLMLCSSVMDDHGFISEESLSSHKRMLRLSLDSKKKIYL